MDKAALYARDLSGAVWQVSPRSHDDEPPDNCVEIAFLDDGAVAMRDSNDRSRSPLRFTRTEWEAFQYAVEHREFSV